MPKRFLVPQYIEMEDKIVGPLSMSQFLYLLGGFIICYFFYTFFDKILAYPLIFLFGALSLSLAFLKINGFPLPRVISFILRYYTTPRERFWSKTDELPKIKVEDRHLKKVLPPKRPSKEEVKSQLAQLSILLDTKGWGEETGKEHGPDEEAFKMRIKSHKEIRPK